jgi:hypothetical protein
MCPMCLTNALMIVGGVAGGIASAGGFAAAAMMRSRAKAPAASREDAVGIRPASRS